MKSSPQKGGRSSSGGSNPENRCDVCNKTFSTRTNLTRHRITHDGKKPYVCKICGNSFTQNGSLKSHMVNFEIILGSLNYGTYVIDLFTIPSSFILESGRLIVKSVERHLLRVNRWYFTCVDVSSFQFQYWVNFLQWKSNNNFIHSNSTDTGEKPFECSHCGVKFRQKDGLKRHVAAKHAPTRAKYHICDVCGKVLLSKYSLNMHLSRHSSKEIAAAKRNRNRT